jgi:hypothetical protein
LQRPIARQYEKDVYVSTTDVDPDSATYLKRVKKLQDRKEVVRVGYCEKHPKRTDAFYDVNEHGWIFRCPGYTAADVRGTQAEVTGPHYVTNRPPLDA